MFLLNYAHTGVDTNSSSNSSKLDTKENLNSRYGESNVKQQGNKQLQLESHHSNHKQIPDYSFNYLDSGPKKANLAKDINTKFNVMDSSSSQSQHQQNLIADDQQSLSGGGGTIPFRIRI